MQQGSRSTTNSTIWTIHEQRATNLQDFQNEIFPHKLNFLHLLVAKCYKCDFNVDFVVTNFKDKHRWTYRGN